MLLREKAKDKNSHLPQALKQKPVVINSSLTQSCTLDEVFNSHPITLPIHADKNSWKIDWWANFSIYTSCLTPPHSTSSQNPPSHASAQHTWNS